MKLILASNSPRRKQILETAGYNFDIVLGDFEENEVSKDPVVTAKTFAFGKAMAVFNRLQRSDALVLGADTVVYLKGKILGKPKDEEDAIKTLKSLSGKTHKVITGFALIAENRFICRSVKTKVTFNKLTDEMILQYVQSGLYQGKAGSYGIQDPYPLVKSYKGSLTNVIGLPIEKLKPILDKMLK